MSLLSGARAVFGTCWSLCRRHWACTESSFLSSFESASEHLVSSTASFEGLVRNDLKAASFLWTFMIRRPGRALVVLTMPLGYAYFVGIQDELVRLLSIRVESVYPLWNRLLFCFRQLMANVSAVLAVKLVTLSGLGTWTSVFVCSVSVCLQQSFSSTSSCGLVRSSTVSHWFLMAQSVFPGIESRASAIQSFWNQSQLLADPTSTNPYPRTPPARTPQQASLLY